MPAPLHHKTVANLLSSELTIGDQIRFKVTSNSMQPLIKIGDTVVVELVAGSTVKLGDIIVIKRADDFLTHRAISPLDCGWLTKGDSTPRPDPPVKFQDIIGRVKIVQQTNQTLYMQERKWVLINPILAKLGKHEATAFSFHRIFRLPFRIMIKLIQKLVF